MQQLRERAKEIYRTYNASDWKDQDASKDDAPLNALDKYNECVKMAVAELRKDLADAKAEIERLKAQVSQMGGEIERLRKEAIAGAEATEEAEENGTISMILGYNSYKGKTWVAKVELTKSGNVKKDSYVFLDAVAYNRRDNYSGTKEYEIPNKEGVYYLECEKKSRRVFHVVAGEIVYV